MTNRHIKNILRLGVLLVFIGLISYGTYSFILVKKERDELLGKVENMTSTLTELQDNLSLTAYEKDRLSNVLLEAEEKANELEEATEKLNEKVEEFEKLDELEPELLKKYSKVYFLNEHYVPKELYILDGKYLARPETPLKIDSRVEPYLTEMLNESDEDGLRLKISSAYRSFEEQKNLKTNYLVTYGTGANKFSADQGYSEHQIGTTIDFTTPEIGFSSSKFETTPEYKWMKEKAYRYGFVLSYPPNNAYYKFEPWHWRFVGIRLARKLHRENMYLYDMDQRQIDEYLINIFD